MDDAFQGRFGDDKLDSFAHRSGQDKTSEATSSCQIKTVEALGTLAGHSRNLSQEIVIIVELQT